MLHEDVNVELPTGKGAAGDHAQNHHAANGQQDITSDEAEAEQGVLPDQAARPHLHCQCRPAQPHGREHLRQLARAIV